MMHSFCCGLETRDSQSEDIKSAAKCNVTVPRGWNTGNNALTEFSLPDKKDRECSQEAQAFETKTVTESQ